MANTGQARPGEGNTSLRWFDAALNRLRHLHYLRDSLQGLDAANDNLSSLAAPLLTQRSGCMVIVWARGHGDVGLGSKAPVSLRPSKNNSMALARIGKCADAP
ncbi:MULTISPECIES: hypothetical protein [unclassified Sinorhizobium]|uniref:hypothetical protein n=1 Tax=unclassified Sinorhizobium TaxID=2613772 RepID=UPI0024C2CB5C|nr:MULTISPECIES: hypothetical protein [unclassified Sinorhizobium]MDK1376536.1 hypothetical protein [Sinorhizobium sp. 6-70]MDK1481505.1 hypothetical protein [Sinorhizobium sp. 6-117]